MRETSTQCSYLCRSIAKASQACASAQDSAPQSALPLSQCIGPLGLLVRRQCLAAAGTYLLTGVDSVDLNSIWEAATSLNGACSQAESKVRC